jgi:hypothetical protein
MKVGSLDVDIVDQVQIKGETFFIVDLGSRYVSGIMTRYLVCPVQQFDRSANIPDKVEVVLL